MVEATPELPAHRRSRQPKLTQPGGLHPDGGGQLRVRPGAEPHRVCQEVPSKQLRHVHPAHHRYYLQWKYYLKVILYQSSSRPSLYFPSCGEFLLLTIISFYDCQTLILTIFSHGTIIDQILEKNTLTPPCIVKIKILKNLFYHFKIQIDKIAKRILWILSLSLYC